MTRGGVLLVAASVAVLPACDKLFDIDPLRDPGDGGASDAKRLDAMADVGPPGDAIVPCFSPPKQVPGINNGLDPQMSGDRLEMIYAKGSPGSYSLFHATRLSTFAAFTETELDTINTSGEETDPALTADRLLLIFKSNRDGNGQHAFQTTRVSVTTPFVGATLVPGVESIAVSGLDISPDGKTIYIDDGDALYVAHRAATDLAFDTAIALTNQHMDYPSVSPNGLELFSNGQGLVRATRATISDADQFAGADLIDANGNDGDVLPDNSAIVDVGGGGAFYILDRCN